MKKFLMLLLAAFCAIVAAWAAYPPGDPNPDAPRGVSIDFVIDDMFGIFYAAPISSAEARYSAGLFLKDPDNLIDVNRYNPNIGTFLFAGGYQATNTNVSFGFAKTLKSFYLGLYYGGSLVNAESEYIKGTEYKYSEWAWENNLTVLVGTKAYGAFRMDLQIKTVTDRDSQYDRDIAKERTDAPVLSFTWGGMKLGPIDPYITAAIKFPDQKIWGTYSGSTYLSVKSQEDAGFGMQAGIKYDFKSASSLFGDVIFASSLGTSYSGDRVLWNGPLLSGSGSSFEIKTGGYWGLGLRAAYGQTATFGKLTFGFKPNAVIGLIYDDREKSYGDFSYDGTSYTNFQLKTGIDLGVNFRLNDTFSFYTGAKAVFFDWRTRGGSNDTGSVWTLGGISWNSGRFAGSGNPGIAMTITPAKDLIIGIGISSLLDNVFNNPDYFHYSVLDFDLTVSYKF